ncbi:DUF4347 domain-containing protein [Sulfurisoma sediminicola]|uniref:Hemolysin type calcium-binding protein n=1 Tax=Sulfurisoma sediminicola TaxID=1381557 RepID=A0A497XCX1_9PROT|nr:DUF4347 domain-containing protein [Sulfurisoma sediminicola]RLJ64793.1 hemolysin type calcium-binding protein [Sulfurisoma sediminicola]
MITNIVFVDSRINGYEALIQALDQPAEVFFIDESSDGLEQIAAQLQGRTDIDAVHILSHGSEGALYLGSSLLSAGNIADYADQLSTIGSALSGSGDILLYGCNVAEGATGREFIDAIARYTGADVAASTDLTGAATLGANWTLEAQSGIVEAAALAMTGYAGVLGTFEGTPGSDTLWGTSSDDILTGFAGDDTYYVDSTGDVVIEASDEGIDTVNASISGYVLADNVENLNLIGLGTSGTGNDLDNTIVGNSSFASVIDGGLGADTMHGMSAYYDVYYVDNAGDVIIDHSDNNGVFASIDYTLIYTFETRLVDLTLIGTDNLNGTGNQFGNTIVGNSGNNILDGGAGGDALQGGQGNDTYILDNVSDGISESFNEGTDSVRSSVTFSLAANLENLELTGTYNLDGTGNELDNVIVGNAGINHLDGGAGNDRLEGGDGNDFLTGGTGVDVFVLGAGSKDFITDFVTGTGGDRIDLGAVIAGFTNYTLGANPFATGHVRLVSSFDFYGTAIQVDIDGGGDAYVTCGVLMNVQPTVPTAANFVGDFDPAQQPDQPHSGDITIPATATEGDWLLSTDTIDDPDNAGLRSYQWQRSSDGSNWTNIDGLAGTQSAFWPDDIDVGKQLRLVASYTDGRGFQTTITTTATAAVVNVNDAPTGGVTVSGTAKEQRTLTAGNTLGDADGLGTIAYQWQSSADGSNWNDIGGATAGSLVLGDAQVGTHVRVVASFTDLHGTLESVASDPTGTVANTIDYSSVSWTLGTGVEDLVLTGTADIDGTGNELDNRITGNSGNNILDGKLGWDTLTGGAGNDSYFVDSTHDVVVEAYDEGIDGVTISVDYQLSANVENLTVATGGTLLHGAGNALDNTLDGNNGYELTLDGNGGNDILIGGTGADTLDGGDGNDSLDGRQGDDTLKGGAGDDTYFVGSTGDVIEEFSTGGTDTVRSSAVSYTLSGNVENLILTDAAIEGLGNGLDNTITGTDGDNGLDGGAGNDTLTGGAGNDIYFVDAAGDIIVEQSGGGTDQVFSRIATYTLAAHVENLTLYASFAVTHLTGNDLDNVITGGEGINYIDGGAGADTMNGDVGNDFYYVDNIGDVISDPAGYNTVFSSISLALPNVAVFLTLTGSANLDGTGNLGTNYITGNSGNNVLDGGGGAYDTLKGGAGDDTYIVRRWDDTVIENANEGVDSVIASDSFVLSGDVENLILTGSNNLDGTGNGLGNVITGNAGINHLDGGAGDDVLDGGAGNDFLTGGAGVDTFKLSTGSKDWITDFVAGAGGDKLDLSGVLAGLSNYTADGNPFASGHVRLAWSEADAYGSWLQVDNDGGGNGFVTIGLLQNVDFTLLTADNFVGGLNPAEQPNQAPVGTVDISGSATEDQWLQSVRNFSDPDGLGEFGYQWQSSTDGISWTNLGGGTQPAFLLGHAEIGLQIRVVESYTDYRGFPESVVSAATTAVVAVNHAPKLVSEVPNQDATDGIAFNYVVPVGTFADIDIDVGDSLSFGATLANGSALPAWLDFDGATRTFAGTPATADIGSLNIKITASDESSLSVSDTFFINVAVNHTITGTAGDDTLTGSVGVAEILVGGLGNDTYVIGDNLHSVVENVGEGTDTVIASVDYQLPANVENLMLGGTWRTGAGNALDNRLDGSGGYSITLYGNGGNDILIGSNSADTLDGGDGNDSLDGRQGNDTLKGGVGNDTYFVGSTSDVIEEFSTGGTDTVFSSAGSYTLSANVENLILTDTAIEGIGNGLDNVITGTDGNNTLRGGAGNDTLTGGAGNDIYVVDSAADVVVELTGEGIDEVFCTIATYTLSANVENLQLYADLAVTHLTGNDLDNAISSGDGIDYIDGGAGADTMNGGAGNDFYYVDNAGDVISDPSGYDTVYSSVSYTLSGYLKYLTLTGTANLNGTGNYNDNYITGNSGNNILDSGAGYLDTLSGGAGDDTYIVQSGADVIIENTGEGIDRVIASDNFVLPDNVENLELTGTIFNLSGTGNDLDNLIVGNGADNLLAGHGGNDTLRGGLGTDTLDGGAGNDTADFSDATAAVVVALTAGSATATGGATDFLVNIENLTGGSGNDSLGGDDGDNVLIGGAGDDALSGGLGNDTLKGGLGRDTLDGGGGNDTADFGDLSVRVVANLGGTVVSGYVTTAGGAIDKLKNIENLAGGSGGDTLTGDAGANVLIGNGGNDVLSGGGGADTLIGGAGNDIYVVDALDTISESLAEGADTVRAGVSWTLGPNLERLELLAGAGNINGTGNAENNTLVGNEGDNTLSGGDGNDTLRGGLGSDALDGGVGIDTADFSDATTAVTVVLSAGAGTATGGSTDNLSNIENLTGGAGNDTLGGDDGANILSGGAGNDTLTGGGGADRLTGGTAADRLDGGDGNDVYVVDDVGDVVIEGSGPFSGIDAVVSSVSYSLTANVEQLYLNGSNLNGSGNDLGNWIRGTAGDNILDGASGYDWVAYGNATNGVVVDLSQTSAQNTGCGMDTLLNFEAVNGSQFNDFLTGNAAANTLSGNAGDDVLNGGAGNDTLNGGSGADTFVFDTTPNATTNFDRISDFVAAIDKFALDRNVFTGLGNGALAADAFVSGAGRKTAADALDRIIYNVTAGVLYFDADGSATASAPIAFAQISSAVKPTLTAADFVVFTGI